MAESESACVCGNLSDDDKCMICRDDTRNPNVICVVQSPKDVIAMEKTKEYNGVYHVLNGVINTAKGVMPQDLNIKSLLDRVNDDTEEVVLATNPTVEGETTALYLAKLLETNEHQCYKDRPRTSMGGHLDYADELTLIKAFEGRKKML